MNIYPGNQCKDAGLTVACLIDASDAKLPELTCLTKGVVFELNVLRKTHNISWNQFYGWAKALGGGSISVPFSSFKVMVGRLEKKKAELS